MKSPYNSIKIPLIFIGILLLSNFWIPQKGFSQGFNNNEWIFGYCGPNTPNNYLSFGKGGDPVVRTLGGGIVVGENNNAVAVDPITGQVLFYTNGELVYNYDNQNIQGVGNGINGDIDGRQTVAIGSLDFDVEGDKLFYIFHIAPNGQLLYSVVDMNAPGGAMGNQPPLGEVTIKDQLIGNASGAIVVVKSANSPSYLISFEGGELVSRQLGATEGDFTQTDTEALGFTPKAILFDEDNGKLILIPENPGEDIVVMDYNTANGTFGNPSSIGQSGGADSIEGAAISPDGTYLYFSRADQLLRVPLNDLDADPEEMPLDADIFKIYDIKVGPDGKLYYIYEETDGGPQLIGRVNNPDGEDPDEFDIEEDPFNGTDFCGRFFPQFAPNQDVNPTVDFEWEPEMPCSNNPVQLTSLITPENFRPVSFEWSFTPPLTDEDGEPLDMDFNQEHLLIPEEATADESITVTLTVTFADGSVSTPVVKTITLLENDLEANFSAQDTTVCEGACVDIGSLLEVQKGGGGMGGETPGGVGGGAGGGENYEYFWSNRRGEGWVTDKNNCVDLPGLYWVLVREMGSQCYAYASIRVKIWDLPDQSNNVWYFGDGAGLDFNQDPNDPDGPLPRPLQHPNNIPAGTTTISDETGQVLFYTDGESVWDLNGNLMENGDAIGGNNLASESVIAVPVPQDETIFYIFTTQKAEDGSNQVKFSVVDIKVDNPTGVGNVVTKDNFLFSPSTEQSAGLTAGDTTWIMFHELGNNTFRAYPITPFGIGSPVFSSVGSNHNFSTGVGSMKFSPDGEQLAVTIRDGACSKLEIFDFDQGTGKLTEYALIDLGCNNDEIYGLEFSDDASRIFVSYTGGGGKVEEFLIKSPQPRRAVGDTEDPPLPCAQCFEDAGSRAEVEACILNSSIRNTLSTAGPFGAIQIGPDGRVYVARPGQSFLGTIDPGANCANSSYIEEGTELLPGTSSNLGLPAFVQQSGSSIPEPALMRPERLCLDPNVGANGLFEGGGEPDIDSYFWTITHEDGEVELSDFGGPGEENQELEHSFARPGFYTVALRVDRCGDATYFEDSMQVEIVAAPEITLPDDITLCAGSPVSLIAIDGYDPADGLYDFEWRNAAGQQIGDIDSNTIEVTEESIYTVTVRFRLPAGLTANDFEVCPATKYVFVGPAFDFDLTQSADEVCYDDALVVFAPNTPLEGEWFYQVEGSTQRVPLGRFFELELEPSSLPSPGQYEIIFVGEDPIVEDCLVEKKASLLVNPLPILDIITLTDADDCNTPNGSLEVTALADIQRIEILETGQVFNNIASGTVLPVLAGLEPGSYTFQSSNTFGCEFTQSAVIQNLNPPSELVGYTATATPEVCGPMGIEEGAIVIDFPNGPDAGAFVITRQGDGLEFTGNIAGTSTTVNVPEGEYAINIFDDNGCAVPFEDLVTVDEKEQVEFSVPSEVEACGEFVFTPSATEAIDFELRGPNNNVIAAEADGSYMLTLSGIYTIRGEDPAGVDCPRERIMDVAINNAVDFSLSAPQIDCDVGVSYEAILQGVQAADVLIFWRNDAGQIVSRNQVFFPSVAGDYTLEVQPRGSTLCPASPIPFTVEEFEFNIDVQLDALPFCGEDVFTIISIENDLRNVATINWFLVQGGGRVPLPGFDGEATITVLESGVYQVVLTNNFGCEIGVAQTQIVKSETVPPILEDSYTICAIENVIVELDPGFYDFYSWVLDGEEVDNRPTFTPTEPGIYQLTVGDNFGCEYTIAFEVVEDCELKIRFPNAIRPSDPRKHFIIFANDFISDVEVFIYNRWGELIYYCQNENVLTDEPICSWNGIARGKVVPIGTYPVVVRYRSINQGITETLRRAIVVIE